MAVATEKNFVIDFDGTFTRVEALEILGEISLEGRVDKEELLEKIRDLTNQGMDGELELRESIHERIKLLEANRDHIEALVKRLQEEVSQSFKRNEVFFREHKDHIFIISNGFSDFIVPIVAEYGVREDHVLANSFEYDEEGHITGFDASNPLSENGGKAATLRKLDLPGEVHVIGDGYTDYEIKEAGVAHKFYAFTENVQRNGVMEQADHVAPSLDEFLYVHKMNKALSYPKNRIRVLLLENIHERAFDLMTEEGYQVEAVPRSLNEEELSERIKDVHILGIRSKTQITEKVLANANKLLAIGAYCIGTDQIDLEACQRNGVAVFNAPYSNTRSVVELAISEIIMLLRNIPDRLEEMKQGIWNKSSRNSFEIRGKNLGILGYGNIGSQLSVLAESLGMKVYFYDLEERLAMGNAHKCHSMEELLRISDVLSLHVDGRPENKGLIGMKELELLPDGAVVINLSRGEVIKLEELRTCMESGKVKGAALDVYPKEPKSNDEQFEHPLKGVSNLILTPHIGGSTVEAQANIADYVPQTILDFVNNGSTSSSVNFPRVKLPVLDEAHRLMHIHHNVPGVLAKIDRILADHNINIVGQYLKTNDTIGYVITDINKEYGKDVIKDLGQIEGTIRVRVLY